MSKKKHQDPTPLNHQRHDPSKPHMIALKPHPKLLLLFSILLVLWIALLLFLYFTTIFPTRHNPP